MLKVSQSEEQKYYAYYFVTLLSSIGSMAYVGCLVAYMLGGGYSFAQIGFTIGITRFMPLLTTLVFGDLADRKNPFNIISTTDFIAVLMSVLMIFAWYAGKDYFHLFLIFTILRSCFVSVQHGARGKLSKLFSQDSKKANTRHAVFFNIATQGANLISGVLGFIFVKYLSFEAVIAFDALSFAASGVVIRFFLQSSVSLEINISKYKINFKTWFEKFKDLYTYAPGSTILDVLLAIGMIGTATLDGVFSQGDKNLVLIFVTGYGLAMCASGLLLNKINIDFSRWSSVIWLCFGGSFAMTFLFMGKNVALVILFSFLKDFFYSLIFHFISGDIQHKTPESKISGVYSARFLQMTVILATGEYIVGSWQSHIGPIAEATWRFGLCVFVSMTVFYLNRSRVRQPKCA